ncbi:hypothetical protein HAX54_008252, partial [Datura stramonium]|nr:hypothetical protein [Datura stramonium]
MSAIVVGGCLVVFRFHWWVTSGVSVVDRRGTSSSDDSVNMEGEKDPVIVRRAFVEVRRKNQGKEEGEMGDSWR